MARDLRLARLFFDLETNSKGLDRELQQAEKSFDRTAKFILANPVAAAGALVAALGAVGVAAAKMAADVDASVRRISAVLPDAATKAESIKDAIDNLATASGRSQQELLATAEAIAKGGVANTEELLNRLNVIQRAADATGGDLITLANGLDQVLDVFGLSGDKIEEVAAKLRAVGAGREPIEDLLGAFQSSARTLKDAGLTFDEATNALARFVAEGLNSKQANAALKDLVGKGGVQAVRDFGGAALDTAAAIEGMNKAADDVANSADRLSSRLRANAMAAFRELGDLILTVTMPILQGLVGILDVIAGRVQDIEIGTAVSQLNQLASNPAGFAKDADAIDRLWKVLTKVTEAAQDGRLALDQMSATQLEQLQRNVSQAMTILGDELSSFGREQANALLTQIGDALKTALATPAPSPLAPAAGGGGGGPILTAKQVADAKRAAEDLKEILANTSKDLADNARLVIDKFIEDIRAKIAEAGDRINADTKAQLETLVSRLEGLREETLQPRAAQDTLDIPGVIKLKDVTEDLAKANKAVADQAARYKKESKEAAEQADKDAKTRKQAAREQALNIERAVRGALQLAEAFGIVNKELASAVESIAQIAANLSGALSGDITSILNVAGGLAQFASSIFGGGGESAAERAHREALEQDAEAIRRLTEVVGEANLAISGGAFSRVRTATGQLGSRDILDLARQLTKFNPFNPNQPIRTGQLDSELRKLGTSLTELEDVAKTLGVSLETDTLAHFIDSINELNKAIAETQLGQFAETLQGRFDSLDAEAEFFGLSVEEQLQRLAEILRNTVQQVDPLTGQPIGGPTGSQVPIIAQALEGLDLTLAKDREEFKRRLGEILKGLSSGAFIGQEALFGDLTPEELRDLILKLGGLIDSVDENTDSQGKTQSFMQENRITETTGTRLAGILESGLLYWREIADNTAAILATLETGATALQAPALPGLESGAAVVVNIGGLTVQFGGLTAGPGTALQTATVLADEIERALTTLINARQISRGLGLQ